MTKKRLSIMITLFILGIVFYYGRGVLLVSQAENVYNNKDCEKVVNIVTTIRQQYPALISPYINQSKKWNMVCQSFLSANAKLHNKDWQIAIQKFTDFLKVYGNTPIAEIAESNLSRGFFDLTDEQHQAGQYEAALNTLTLIEAKDEKMKISIEKKRSQIYFERAITQRVTGQYEAALNTLTLIGAEDEDTKTKIKKERFWIYFDWVKAQREAGQYETALYTTTLIETDDEYMKTLIDEERSHIYLDWGKAQHETVQYDEDVLYIMLKNDNENKGGEIPNERMQVYLNWVADLKKHGETQQAIKILTTLWNHQKINQQQALPSGLTEHDLIIALGLSTGEYAQELMKMTLLMACEGKPSSLAALATSKIQQMHIQFPIKAFTTINTSVFPQETAAEWIESNLIARTLNKFHHAICIEEEAILTERCTYRKEASTTFEYIDLVQAIWHVELRDVRTGQLIRSEDFLGEKLSSSEECPYEASGGTIKTGPRPSIINVLNKVLRMTIPENIE